ncbi:MAG: TlyA family RNA methyltransferase [Desulfobulbaceae bacterium]|nr:MAG: TlyA family RNA methyltransferase [Desulfobulbaceae bacterium]
MDQLALDSGHFPDLKAAIGAILAGNVYVDDTVIDKPGTLVENSATLRFNLGKKYVSRGGLKLEGAIAFFQFDPTGLICADIGASSGGFTDCLLQHGANHVYAIDVAYGQLDWTLRNDERVTILERCNIRKISTEQIPPVLDLAVFDTSFVSLTKVIPPVLSLFRETISIIALIKPQFELPKSMIAPGGIVASEDHRQQAIDKIKAYASQSALKVQGVTPSTIKGPKGNQEYLIYLSS